MGMKINLLKALLVNINVDNREVSRQVERRGYLVGSWPLFIISVFCWKVIPTSWISSPYY